MSLAFDDCRDLNLYSEQNSHVTVQKHIDNTLDQRGIRYGDFVGVATTVQGLKDVMRKGQNWSTLPPDMKEALEMIAHKIGRILNGNPEYHDSWHDIIGYTRLIEQKLFIE